MNLLIEKAPDFITVGGEKIKINTSFNIWVEFFIACNSDNEEKLAEALCKVFVDGIPNTDITETISACLDWLFPKDNTKKKAHSKAYTNSKAFDFDMDGNLIYCELWEYFPHLMERGISFHEGMELIALLMSNEKTMLHHRAFARCGDFSKMDKEQKKYWRQERTKWAIPTHKNEIDDVFSKAF